MSAASSESCTHDVVFKGLCAICGKTVETTSGPYGQNNNQQNTEKFVVEHPGLLGTLWVHFV
jgi:hypothetical protein